MTDRPLEPHFAGFTWTKRENAVADVRRLLDISLCEIVSKWELKREDAIDVENADRGVRINREQAEELLKMLKELVADGEVRLAQAIKKAAAQNREQQ